MDNKKRHYDIVKKDKIIVQDIEITILSEKNGEYISLTDMAGYKDNLKARIVVSNWMSIFSKSGRYGGGIFAHKGTAIAIKLIF